MNHKLIVSMPKTVIPKVFFTICKKKKKFPLPLPCGYVHVCESGCVHAMMLVWKLLSTLFEAGILVHHYINLDGGPVMTWEYSLSLPPHTRTADIIEVCHHAQFYMDSNSGPHVWVANALPMPRSPHLHITNNKIVLSLKTEKLYVCTIHVYMYTCMCTYMHIHKQICTYIWFWSVVGTEVFLCKEDCYVIFSN